MKMDEIRRETERLIREKQNMDREKSAKKTFDKRAKETTRELTGKNASISHSNYSKHLDLNILKHKQTPVVKEFSSNILISFRS